MALLPAHLLQHLEPQVLVSQLLLGEVKVLGFLKRDKGIARKNFADCKKRPEHGPARAAPGTVQHPLPRRN